MPDARTNGAPGRRRSAKPDSPYVISCSEGMPHAPGSYPQGRFLAWVRGCFVPCCQPAVATPYRTRQIALDVAARAAQAFPGARFEVVTLGGVPS